MRADVLTEVARLEPLRDAWDEMAVACSRPRSAPDWVVGWYRHLLPRHARVRVVVVWDGDVLAAVMPLFVRRNPLGLHKYQLAGTGILYGVEPLVRPGADVEALPVLAAAVSRLRPRPDIVDFDCVVDARRWLDPLRQAWAGPTPREVDGEVVAPFMWLGDGHEQWLAARSSAFRKEVRSWQRKLRAEGFEPRTHVDATAVRERLPALAGQYEERRQARAGAGLDFDRRVRAMIEEAAARLDGSGRACLVTWERAGEVAGTELGVGAGRELSAWLSGFASAWSHLSPGIVTMATLAEQAAGLGYEVLDLGPGAEPYKARFTDRARTLGHSVLSGRNLWPFHSPAQLVPPARREALVARLMRGRMPPAD